MSKENGKWNLAGFGPTESKVPWTWDYKVVEFDTKEDAEAFIKSYNKLSYVWIADDVQSVQLDESDYQGKETINLTGKIVVELEEECDLELVERSAL